MTLASFSQRNYTRAAGRYPVDDEHLSAERKITRSSYFQGWGFDRTPRGRRFIFFFFFASSRFFEQHRWPTMILEYDHSFYENHDNSTLFYREKCEKGLELITRVRLGHRTQFFTIRSKNRAVDLRNVLDNGRIDVCFFARATITHKPLVIYYNQTFQGSLRALHYAREI